MFIKPVFLSLGLLAAWLVFAPALSQAEDTNWFSFLDNEDPLFSLPKDQQIGCSDLKISVGGSLRSRYINEVNRLRPPGAVRTDYQQWRFTPFMELNYKDDIKGFVKIINADTFGEDAFPLPIDENRWDLLEAYIDTKLIELDKGDLRLQSGRQLLSYGKQRTVSPLAWANTYRNFEGFKGYYQGEDWNIDAFVVRPLNAASRGVRFKPDALDTPDQSNYFSGIYATKKDMQNLGALDVYWLWSNEREQRILRQDGNRHTLGARIYGKKEITSGCCGVVERTWSWDVEGAYQFGSDFFATNPGTELDVVAGFFTTEVGHTWNKVNWTPTVKGLFYYGSGDGNTADGNTGTYYSMYPLGHAYWGLIDNFSGQNLIDYSLQTTVKPTKKLTLLSALHYFTKAESEDAIYNIAGAPLGATGAAGVAAGRKIGTELDMVATYKVNSNLTLQTGYFWFWYSDAVQNTLLNRDDASQFYFSANYDF